MKKTSLIKISLILFLIIFGIVYFVEESYELEKMNISQIDDTFYNNYVKIYAKVITIRNFNETIFLILKDETKEIPAIIFEKVEIEKNQNYYFEGKITKYNGDLELIVERFEKNKND